MRRIIRKVILAITGKTAGEWSDIVARKKQPFSESRAIFELLRRTRPRGVMVDVGAHFGESFRPYADLGWTIYAFEPDPDPKKIQSIQRSLPRNSRFRDIALSDSPAQAIPFYSSQESTGVSTLNPFLSSHKPTSVVKADTLENIIKEEGIQKIDFLKIDAEGHDLLVLRGLNWIMRPDIILCEFEDKKTTKLDYNYEQMGHYLLDEGYCVFLSEWFPIVRYGIDHEWRCLKRFPCQLEDPAAWGNFIALRPELESAFLAVLERGRIDLTPR